MNLIALLIGLFVERLATQLFHLRQLRWLDRVIDAGFRQADRFRSWPALIPLTVLAILLVLPLAVVIVALGDTLYGFPYLILAVVVLFFSLGPKDIGEQVHEYCKAVSADDPERIHKTARSLLEKDVPDDPRERSRQVEAAVCVQANNRLFAVIFWFVLLGPLGAWAYRVTDLIRRRAVFIASRDDATEAVAADVAEAAGNLHAWLAWIPARLTAFGYALAGSFDGAISALRSNDRSKGATTGERNEMLLARAGLAALALSDEEGESASERGVRGAMAANGLVLRLLGIWALAIALMTLSGLSL
ncbi:MAG: regulatory signaling modulator protein AmpE [Gammaproteobacteria bacterium]|nr:regulatory signaling modulator protein AmpE [Gammaproteobacteria bacterium]MDH4254387.1 regulatory signaling modulator protein AmpE [Gammaproteobacteria bacterium]MDH5309320.1 regulatory signaling modulator protein AmpE [Gammaproteobacteria bacterium]